MKRKHLPWNPEWLLQIWARVGATVWQAQCVEDTLAKTVVLAFQVSEGDGVAVATDLLTDNKKMTLGALMSKLQGLAKVPDRLAADLEAFKEERNWVIHHCYGDVVKSLHDLARLEKTVSRIEHADLLGHGLHSALWDVAQALSDEFDAGEPLPSETARRIRSLWRKPNSPLEEDK